MATYRSNPHFSSTGKNKAYRQSERQQDSVGKWWIAPRVACRITGYARSTLRAWSLAAGQGCPALGGAKLAWRRFPDGNGRLVRYYAEEEVDQLIGDRSPGVPVVPGYVMMAEATGTYGIDMRVLLRLRKAGKLKVLRRCGRDAVGRRCEYKLLSVSDLEAHNRQRQAAAPPADKITVAEAAKLLRLHPPAMYRLVREKRLKTYQEKNAFRGAVRGGVRLRECLLLRRSDVEKVRAEREAMPRLGEPFACGGITWLTEGVTREKLRAGHTTLALFRRTSCYLLDGREPRTKLVKRRPILAIQLPLSEGRQVWYYHPADVELAAARQRGLMSLPDAARQADKILRACKTSMGGAHVVTNFGDLECEPRKGRGRPSSVEKHHRWLQEHEAGKSLGEIALHDKVTRRAVADGIAKARKARASEVNSQPD